MTPPDPHEVAETAAGRLKGGARRALLAMSEDWQFPGRATFNAHGAWSLRWERGFGGRGALSEVDYRKDGKRKRAAYRLTPLGAVVRDLILKESRHDR